MSVIVREKASAILEAANEEQRRSLLIDRHYGAPYSFWSSAKAYGLATDEDVQQARSSYGNLWHYRGD